MFWVGKIYKFSLWMLKMVIHENGVLASKSPIGIIDREDIVASETVLTDLKKSLNVLCYGNAQGDKTEKVHLGKVLKNTLEILDRVDFGNISQMDYGEARKTFRNIAKVYNMRMSDLRKNIDEGLEGYTKNDARLARGIRDRISNLGERLNNRTEEVETSMRIRDIMQEDKTKDIGDNERYVGRSLYDALQKKSFESNSQSNGYSGPGNNGNGSNGNGSNGNGRISEGSGGSEGKRSVHVRSGALKRAGFREPSASLRSILKGFGQRASVYVRDSFDNSRGYLSNLLKRSSFGTLSSA